MNCQSVTITFRADCVQCASEPHGRSIYTTARWRSPSNKLISCFDDCRSRFSHIVASCIAFIHPGRVRSEERRVGQEGVSTCRSRWARFHEKKNKKTDKRA